MCISVDLPDPDGPMIAVNDPRVELDGHAAQRVDGGVALAEALGDLVAADDGGAGRLWRESAHAGNPCSRPRRRVSGMFPRGGQR